MRSSMCGGAPKITQDILANGKTFVATTNLVAAFQNISATGMDSSDFLWVDAICINQNDLEERTAQVQMMGSIFFRAPNACWFGWGLKKAAARR
jgi:hypothetical protein